MIMIMYSELERKHDEAVMLCKISGSHGSEYEDGCLLGCCAV
jgi:hypothetical protein